MCVIITRGKQGNEEVRTDSHIDAWYHMLKERSGKMEERRGKKWKMEGILF